MGDWVVQGTNGQSADSFRFAIRKQLTSHLCMRLPNKQTGKQATRRGYGATVHAEGEEEDEFGFVTLVRQPERTAFVSPLPSWLCSSYLHARHGSNDWMWCYHRTRDTRSAHTPHMLTG